MKEKADLTVAPLKINPKHPQGIEFSKPFLGIRFTELQNLSNEHIQDQLLVEPQSDLFLLSPIHINEQSK